MSKKKAITKDNFFKIPRYDGCGVYAIVSWEDMSCYIGSSRNIKQRATQHHTLLKAGIHQNRNLQKAYNDGKILRFLLLSKLPKEIENDVLLMIEYLYMLQISFKCFGLYNVVPSSDCYRTRQEVLMVHIIARLDMLVSASSNIENALQKEYGSKSGYMRNTKYKEWSAKQEIKQSEGK